MSPRLSTAASALVFVLASSPAFAAECTRYEYDKAQTLAQRAGSRIVDKFLGGRNVRVRLKSCDLNAYENRYQLQVDVSWNGVFFEANEYDVGGDLSFRPDGSDSAFRQTFASESVKSFELWTVFAAGVVILGTLAAESEKPPPQTVQSSPAPAEGAPVIFDNRCARPVRIAIYVKDQRSNTWRGIGWWNFAARQRSRLEYEGEEVRTREQLLFFHAYASDGSDARWEGEDKWSVNGVSLPMRKVVDERPNMTEVKLTCG